MRKNLLYVGLDAHKSYSSSGKKASQEGIWCMEEERALPEQRFGLNLAFQELFHK